MAAKDIAKLSTSPMPMLQWAYLFLRGQYTRLAYPQDHLTDQVVIVTGANTGLALKAARHFARLNAARVILAVRNINKSNTAADDIARSTGVNRNRLEIWPLDLSDFKSIIHFGEKVNQIDRLDALAQNAGILTQQWKKVEGMESHVAIDLVAPMLLGMLVLPKMKQSASKYGSHGHLAFVGSETEYFV